MPHMVAQEHLSMVEALRYGTARNQATITAALAAIGSTPARLVLTNTGDGIWTITSNTTMPSNVILEIPMGVTVNVATGITLGVGLVIAHQNTWKTGPGTVNKSAVATPMEISNLVCTTYVQSNSIGGVIWELNDAPSGTAVVRGFLNQAATCGLTISRAIGNTNSTWNIYTPSANGELAMARPGGTPVFFLNNTGLMLGGGATPSGYTLQLGSGDAAKVTGASWVVTSDGRVKDRVDDYRDGLPMLLALPRPIRFTLNGKANTPRDGREVVGMIGQDVQRVAPYMIHTYKARLEPDDAEETDILSMDSSPLIFAVINALREIDTRLRALEAA